MLPSSSILIIFGYPPPLSLLVISACYPWMLPYICAPVYLELARILPVDASTEWLITQAWISERTL